MRLVSDNDGAEDKLNWTSGCKRPRIHSCSSDVTLRTILDVFVYVLSIRYSCHA